MMTILNGSKRIISASGGLGLLQMISELGTERCASKDSEPRKGVDCEILYRLERGMIARRWAPKGVDCEIPHRLERKTKHYL